MASVEFYTNSYDKGTKTLTVFSPMGRSLSYIIKDNENISDEIINILYNILQNMSTKQDCINLENKNKLKLSRDKFKNWKPWNYQKDDPNFYKLTNQNNAIMQLNVYKNIIWG